MDTPHPLVPPSPTRSKIMSSIRSKDTKIEWQVRRALWHAGFRYRLHVKTLPGKPDIVLPRYRTVVLVHGCFWHGHGCRLSSTPKTNAGFWAAKIARNKERDSRVEEQLRSRGYQLWMIWECQLESSTRELVAHLMDIRAAPNSG